MTRDQARKLLGGYATNSLTESERQALYEAALEDQELFNALQDEQTLKELLADPVSRAQIHQTLVTPASTRAPFWSRPWTWGGVVGAVAATVLILAVLRTTPPQHQTVSYMKSAPAPPVVPRQAEPKPAEPTAPQPRAISRESRPAQRPQPVPLAPPPSSVADAVSHSAGVRSEAAQNAPPPPPPARAAVAPPEAAAFSGRTAAGLGGVVAGFSQPLLRYSLLKSDSSGTTAAGLNPGDAVRISVTPSITGYLSIERFAPSGEWARLYPNTEPGLLVTANTARIIPDTPIVAGENEQRLRLKLVPLSEADQLAKKDSSPIVIELTIGARKAP